MQASSKLSNMTETSREALVVFAENVDGVNNSLKNLNIAIKKQGDLLAVNEKLVFTLDKIEKRVKQTNDNTVGELRLITETLVKELNNTSKTLTSNNAKLNSSLSTTLKNVVVSNRKAIAGVVKQVSNKAIYKQIVANQAIQAQQISRLVKQNNSVLGKIADKSSRIKYP